jgi:hypothetical protein
MKPVLNAITDSAPDGTAWFGGPVDRLTMSLRVRATEPDWPEVNKILGCSSDARRGLWRIEAAARLDGDLDAQLRELLSRVHADSQAWSGVQKRWGVDVFCGLFLERPNRGVSLSNASLRSLSDRNLTIGFDIYAPDARQA